MLRLTPLLSELRKYHGNSLRSLALDYSLYDVYHLEGSRSGITDKPYHRPLLSDPCPPAAEELSRFSIAEFTNLEFLSIWDLMSFYNGAIGRKLYHCRISCLGRSNGFTSTILTTITK